MILVELFDTSINFQFQNFLKAEFSRYGGLYALANFQNWTRTRGYELTPLASRDAWEQLQDEGLGR